jgi:hypothetical protein
MVLASSNADAIAQMGRERGAVQVDVTPISLREIFLETVKEQNAKEQRDALV